MQVRREMVEAFAFSGVIALYALLREQIAGRAVFIVPASLLVFGYACLMIRTGSATLSECGIGRTNLRRATFLTLSVSIPVAIALLLIAPNIIPLGIAHGILGAILYHLVLGRDQLSEFVN